MNPLNIIIIIAISPDLIQKILNYYIYSCLGFSINIIFSPRSIHIP